MKNNTADIQVSDLPAWLSSLSSTYHAWTPRSWLKTYQLHWGLQQSKSGSPEYVLSLDQRIISGEIANFVSFSWVLPTAGIASRGQTYMLSWIWLFWPILEYFTIVFKNTLVSAIFARAIGLVAFPDNS